MIIIGSRYENGESGRVEIAAGVYNVFVSPPPVRFDNISVSTAITVDGDRFDRLATKLWGDPTKWWVLADVNPEIEFPAGPIAPGTVIRIPVSQ